MPVPIERILNWLELVIASNLLRAKKDAIGAGLFTTTPPSIKPLCEGKYVGAAELAIAASITENSDVLF